jgi:mono/diheme cytochrome c family protein
MAKAIRRSIPAYCLAIGFFVAQGNAFAADPTQGKTIAERWCSGCHVVGPTQTSAPADQAPPFASLALRPDFDEARLALLLLSPHPNMPKLALSRFEIADLADYIRTLK